MPVWFFAGLVKFLSNFGLAAFVLIGDDDRLLFIVLVLAPDRLCRDLQSREARGFLNHARLSRGRSTSIPFTQEGF